MSKQLLNWKRLVELPTMTLLGLGLVHCSDDPASIEQASNGGGMPTAVGGDPVVPAAGTSSQTGGQNVAGYAMCGKGGTTAGGGGVSAATPSGSGGVAMDGG